MEIKLLKSINYEKLKKELKRRNIECADELIDYIEVLEKEERVGKVSSAGRLSRFKGDVFDVVELASSKTLEENTKYAKKVTSMGHDSITDHDYLVFAIKDVSPILEQTLIEERFSSFTIKSRREVDFSNVGYYIPNFHDDNGNLLENNLAIQEEYKNYMDWLFNEYANLERGGIPKEDARFILPYSYHSNIIMGIDAHTLKDMIIKFTKGSLSKISEIKEFGMKLYEIAKDNIPYILEAIDNANISYDDETFNYLNSYNIKDAKKIINHVKLLNSTKDVDDTILISSIMKNYQYDYDKASKIYERLVLDNPDFKKDLMRIIAFKTDKQEFTQVHFEYQVPTSLAVLTHFTRHRTLDILIPSFVHGIDITKYKIPKSILNSEYNERYKEIYKINKEVYDHFKNDYNICDEDLVYFLLSGVMINVIINADGKALEHILALRECNKAQWETRNIAKQMHKEIDKLDTAYNYSSILGSSCMTQGVCNEKSECCGKVYTLIKKK